jgi:hypothetical protein
MARIRKHIRLTLSSRLDPDRKTGHHVASSNGSSRLRCGSCCFTQAPARIGQPHPGSTASPITHPRSTIPYPFPERRGADFRLAAATSQNYWRDKVFYAGEIKRCGIATEIMLKNSMCVEQFNTGARTVTTLADSTIDFSGAPNRKTAAVRVVLAPWRLRLRE